MEAGSSGLGEKLVVRRGRVDSVDIFEVKENELDLLENGSPASLQLNFSIFLLSLAFSSILTITTATVKYPILEIFYIVIAVVGFFLGMYLLFSWWKTRASIKKIVTTIRKRIPVDIAISAQAPDAQGEYQESNQLPSG